MTSVQVQRPPCRPEVLHRVSLLRRHLLADYNNYFLLLLHLHAPVPSTSHSTSVSPVSPLLQLSWPSIDLECSYLYRWIRLLRKTAGTHRCSLPDRRLLENRMENTGRLQLEETQRRSQSTNQKEAASHSASESLCCLLTEQLYRPPTHDHWTTSKEKKVLQSSPCWVSQRSPVQPASQKQEPVPLRPASHDPCSEQLQAENQKKKTKCQDHKTCRHQTVWPLLTFTGGSIEPITAQLTGHAPEACVTGTGSVTKVTVVTFTTVTAGRAHPAGTDWRERTTSSDEETAHHK